MKIVNLQAENIKRLRAVEITPQGNMVIIGGKNAQGKSSVLDSIEMVLGGDGAVPAVPIHRSATKARIVADLGDLVVKRTFSTSGSYLSVENKDGTKPKSPQTILDQLVGTLSFDPLAFSRMDTKEQLEVVKKLTGLDFSDLEAARTEAYDERTVVNRQFKAAKTQVEAAQFFPDAPKAEVVVSELAEQLVEIEKSNSALEPMQKRQKEVELIGGSLQDDLARTKEMLARIEKDIEANSAEKKDLDEKVKSFKWQDEAAIRAQISGSEADNMKVRANLRRAALKKTAGEFEKKFGALSDTIAKIDADKAKLVSEAKMPVEGLGLGEDGVTFNGLPFSQCSSAEQLRISVAMGLALNPKLKVLLIRDGSLLDEDSLKALAEQAATADAQVWIERVGDKDKCAVIIEDGAVKDAE